MNKNLFPTELFREKKIEIFFNEKQKKIIGDLESFPEAVINEIDFEKEADNIIERSNFDVPKLLKEKTTTEISTIILTHRQLPPGMLFRQGQNYEVEVANYSVPFIGNKDFFKIFPHKYHSANISAVLTTGSIIFKLTNYGKITGNDSQIEYLKKEFLLNIEATEKTLHQIDEEVSDYIPKLRVLIIEGLKNRKQFLDSKKDSTNKLNPFK